jgi:hypothetical protein
VDDSVKLVAVVALASLLGLWVLSTFLFRIGGTWERVLSDAELKEGTRPERITLGQLGPWISGRRDVKGGHQEYSGVMVGRRVTLTRRDHGKQALLGMGFPEPVAVKLEGEVMARMRLTLVDGGTSLVGVFEPQKVEFTHQPPRITSMYFLPGQKRRYRRVEPVSAHERVTAAIDEVEPTATGV